MNDALACARCRRTFNGKLIEQWKCEHCSTAKCNACARNAQAPCLRIERRIAEAPSSQKKKSVGQPRVMGTYFCGRRQRNSTHNVFPDPSSTCCGVPMTKKGGGKDCVGCSGSFDGGKKLWRCQACAASECNSCARSRQFLEMAEAAKKAKIAQTLPSNSSKPEISEQGKKAEVQTKIRKIGVVATAAEGKRKCPEAAAAIRKTSAQDKSQVQSQPKLLKRPGCSQGMSAKSTSSGKAQPAEESQLQAKQRAEEQHKAKAGAKQSANQSVFWDQSSLAWRCHWQKDGKIFRKRFRVADFKEHGQTMEEADAAAKIAATTLSAELAELGVVDV